MRQPGRVALHWATGRDPICKLKTNQHIHAILLSCYPTITLSYVALPVDECYAAGGAQHPMLGVPRGRNARTGGQALWPTNRQLLALIPGHFLIGLFLPLLPSQQFVPETLVDSILRPPFRAGITDRTMGRRTCHRETAGRATSKPRARFNH